MKLLLFQAIYRGSYLLAVLLLTYAWQLFRSRQILLGGVVLVGFWLFVRMRWIEPYSVQVKYHQIPFDTPVRVGLIADLHLGVYKDESFLWRIVDQLNQEDIDLVMVAGDLTFEPLAGQVLERLFAPLGALDIPVFAVLGNHDVQHPGPAIRDELIQALQDNNVTVLQNDIVEFSTFWLVGLGPHMSGEDQVSLLSKLPADRLRIVLTHNPDSTLKYDKRTRAEVTLVGHTHCGQIRIPYLYKWLIPTEGEFDCGLSDQPMTRLYITPGLGEVILPMRLGVQPRIDIISFE